MLHNKHVHTFSKDAFKAKKLPACSIIKYFRPSSPNSIKVPSRVKIVSRILVIRLTTSTMNFPSLRKPSPPVLILHSWTETVILKNTSYGFTEILQ